MTREESKALVGQRRAAARYLEAIARRGEVLARPHWCGLASDNWGLRCDRTRELRIEMLRAVHCDGMQVAAACRKFGVSKTSYYAWAKSRSFATCTGSRWWRFSDDRAAMD